MKDKIYGWFVHNYPDIHQKMKKCEHTHSNGSVNPFHWKFLYCR